MTKHDPASDDSHSLRDPTNGETRPPDIVVSQRVHERVVSRTCAACGETAYTSERGRPPQYCSAACRQRAWALRQAAKQLAREDPRPEVVREVIERETVIRVRPAEASREIMPVTVPNTGRDWAELLGDLAQRLQVPQSAVAQQHWHHPRLYEALVHAMAALGQAHPGGLEQLQRRHR